MNVCLELQLISRRNAVAVAASELPYKEFMQSVFRTQELIDGMARGILAGLVWLFMQVIAGRWRESTDHGVGSF